MRFSKDAILGTAMVLVTVVGSVVSLTGAAGPRKTSVEPEPAATPFIRMQQLLGANTSSPPPTATTSPSPTPAPPPTPNLVWGDDFSAPAGTLPDPRKWNMDVGGHGWWNDEWQYYTNSAANVAHDGEGHLLITALRPVVPPGPCASGPCNITSARLQTQGLFAAQYGRFEARIKLPVGQGLWPAFWMLPDDDSGEIDVMENNGRDPSIISSTLHGPGTPRPSGLSSELGLLPGNMTDVFHVYAVDWNEKGIKWSVDGRTIQAVNRGDPRVGAWVYDKPFYLLMNLAVGGEDPGYPDASTPFPARMVVDYVRVYR